MEHILDSAGRVKLYRSVSNNDVATFVEYRRKIGRLNRKRDLAALAIQARTA